MRGVNLYCIVHQRWELVKMGVGSVLLVRVWCTINVVPFKENPSLKTREPVLRVRVQGGSVGFNPYPYPSVPYPQPARVL